jgi:DNA polymerase-3 subunit delta'
MDLFGSDEFLEEPEEEGDSAPLVFEEKQALLPPRENYLCLGHDDVERDILRAFNAKKLPHALIFSGLEGIGKSTFAFRLARFLLARPIEDPNQDALFAMEPVPDPVNLDLDTEHPVFRRVASGGHADLLTIARAYDDKKDKQKATLDVAEIRKVAPFLRKTAAEGGWRVVIVDDADTMGRSAQNALLKILEEPPAQTVIILVTHRAGALIPTIRSRSRLFEFNGLSAEHMSRLLQIQGHNLGMSESMALHHLAEGSLGKALELIEGGGLDVMAKIMAVLEDYPNLRWSQLHAISEDFSRVGGGASFEAFADIMMWMVRQMTVAKARHSALPSGPMTSPVFQDMLHQTSLMRLVAMNDNLTELFEVTARANLEKRQAVLKAFTILMAA